MPEDIRTDSEGNRFRMGYSAVDVYPGDVVLVDGRLERVQGIGKGKVIWDWEIRTDSGLTRSMMQIDGYGVRI